MKWAQLDRIVVVHEKDAKTVCNCSFVLRLQVQVQTALEIIARTKK